MADERLNIIIRIKNAGERSITEIQKKFVLARTAALGLGKALTSVQAGLAALIGGGAFLLFMRSSIKVFTEFDDTMRAAGAIAGATAEEFEDLSRIAQKMGRETRYSAAEAADGLRFLGMAGFDVKEQIAALPGVLNLAAAGGLELGQAADIATNILTGFNLEIEQLSVVNDVLAKTFTSSNTNLVELGEGFKLVGPIAAGVGGDFEDLVGSLGKLADAGLKGTIGGTALRGAIDALLNPTAQEAQLMKELEQRMGGVELKVRDTEGRFIGFVEVIKQLEAAGLKGDEALKLFGLRAGPGMAALLGVGSDALRDYRDGLKDATGTTDRIATEMEAGLGGATRRMKAAFEGLKIAIGDALEENLIDWANQIGEAFVKLTETIQELADSGKIKEWAGVAEESFEVVIWAVQKTAQAFLFLGKLVGIVTLGMAGHSEAAKKAHEDNVVALAKLLGTYKETDTDTFYKIDKSTGEVVETTELLNSEVKELQDQYKKTGEEAAKAAQDAANAAKGPIGQADATAGPTTPILGPSDEAQVQSDVFRLKQIIETQLVQLESSYDQGKTKLADYFRERAELTAEAIEAEIGLLTTAAAAEGDLDKRQEINDKIFALKQELERSMLQLTMDRLEQEAELERQRTQQAAEEAQRRLEIDRVFSDIKSRIELEGTAALDAQFLDEEAKLQERHNRELEILQENLATKAEINALADEQELEKKKLHESQMARLTEFRLQAAKDLAGGLSDVFQNLYELTGKKNKELFYAAKAAALAEATINIAQGITKAWAQGGLFGAIGAAVVAASGAIQIATIISQTYATGGEVEGRSPTKTSDNIVARLTAGEFVQPVDTVRYYGKGFMEALRRRAIPKSMLTGFGMPNVMSPTMSFATGGLAGPPAQSANGDGEEREPVTINNIVDPQMMDQHLVSHPGQRSVMNVISENKYELKQLVLGE